MGCPDFRRLQLRRQQRHDAVESERLIQHYKKMKRAAEFFFKFSAAPSDPQQGRLEKQLFISNYRI